MKISTGSGPAQKPSLPESLVPGLDKYFCAGKESNISYKTTSEEQYIERELN